MRRLASREPERWRTMPMPERMAEAGRVIADDLKHAAEVRELRTALQIEAHARHRPTWRRPACNRASTCCSASC